MAVSCRMEEPCWCLRAVPALSPALSPRPQLVPVAQEQEEAPQPPGSSVPAEGDVFRRERGGFPCTPWAVRGLWGGSGCSGLLCMGERVCGVLGSSRGPHSTVCGVSPSASPLLPGSAPPLLCQPGAWGWPSFVGAAAPQPSLEGAGAALGHPPCSGQWDRHQPRACCRPCSPPPPGCPPVWQRGN